MATSQFAKEIISTIDKSADAQRVMIARSRSNDLNDYAILEQVPVQKKQEFVQAAASDHVYDRIMGSMSGMGVGDSIGHIYEFLPVRDKPEENYFDLKSFKFHGESNTFGLQRGQWTDDSSMGLCMADSLIMCEQFDGSDMRIRFWCWWNRGYNNAFRKDPSRDQSVGLGGNISKSLSQMNFARQKSDVQPAYQASGEDAGNGSLMRFTPIAIFLSTAPLDVLYDVSRASSYTTHPGIMAAEACTLLAHIIQRAIHRPPGSSLDMKAFLEQACEEYFVTSGLDKKSGWGYDQMTWLVKSQPVNATERCWDWKNPHLDLAGTLRARGSSYNGYPVSAGYFGSYCMDGLALALWACYHTTSFDEAVTKCINLCGDADSHGSIAAQIAGAFYGYKSINPKFLEWLNRWDDHDFATRAILLHEIGKKYVADDLPQTIAK